MTTLGRSRSAIIGSFAVVILLGAVPAAAEQRSDPVMDCPVPDRFEIRDRDWTTIWAPEWPKESYDEPYEHPYTQVAYGAIRAFAVAPWDDRLLYASNGAVLLKSSDGGCRWEQILTLDRDPSPELPLVWPAIYIDHVAISEHPSARDRIYVVMGSYGERHAFKNWGQAGPMAFGASDDGGKSWRFNMLDPTKWQTYGSYYRRSLVVSPTDPDLLYLWAGDVDGEFLRSRDAGRQWESMRLPFGGNDAPVADPLDGRHLWMIGHGSETAVGSVCGGDAAPCRAPLWESTDAGDTWQWVDGGLGRYALNSANCFPPDVVHRPGEGTRIALLCGSQLVRSDDGGRSWYSMISPGNGYQTITHGVRPDSFILAGGFDVPAVKHEPRLAARGQYPWVTIANFGYNPYGSCVVGHTNPIYVSRQIRKPVAFFLTIPGSGVGECQDGQWIDRFSGRF